MTPADRRLLASGRIARVAVTAAVVLGVLAAALAVAQAWLLARSISGAFLGTALAIAFAVFSLFAALFPEVMPSSTDPAYSLTITNSSSTEYTLTIMTVVAVLFVPIVLLYQGWTYWVFRKRVASPPVAVES